MVANLMTMFKALDFLPSFLGSPCPLRSFLSGFATTLKSVRSVPQSVETRATRKRRRRTVRQVGTDPERASDAFLVAKSLQLHTLFWIQPVREHNDLYARPDRQPSILHEGSDAKVEGDLLDLGSIPSEIQRDFAVLANVAGSPESCRRPFQRLALAGSEQ